MMHSMISERVLQPEDDVCERNSLAEDLETYAAEVAQARKRRMRLLLMMSTGTAILAIAIVAAFIGVIDWLLALALGVAGLAFSLSILQRFIRDATAPNENP